MGAIEWKDLVRALALVLVLEGLWPFLSPRRWREALLRMSTLDDRGLRTVGLLSLLTGLVVLHLA
ncbi:MAG: DUF2065 domain-containing protein [Gammaproteobacteria bacterium]|nr:DUF2065 domain-containing protein [Gammaproteobacteria bacterium]